ncbi:hypothetical cytosolic protein [Syntrophus aciditrophicus SB]|uniref:Hypothetical cytosolic protein n=1 Tax=Syntrophus aciditrophicus (strain SB) TaxID=56780 RepID=Q2LSL6_SYNAS|nr:hypothetical cytosolic protein [Syntrophus aciditrophicus SB]
MSLCRFWTQSVLQGGCHESAIKRFVVSEAMQNRAEVQLERIDSRICKEDCLQEIRKSTLFKLFSVRGKFGLCISLCMQTNGYNRSGKSQY